MKTKLCLFAFVLFVFDQRNVRAYTSRDFAVEVEARIVSGGIVVDWPANGVIGDYSISRKEYGAATGWQALPSSGIQQIGTVFSYTDSDVTTLTGKKWEYEVVRGNINPQNPDKYGYSAGYGYVSIGYQPPITHGRGKLILMVDRTSFENDSTMPGLLRRFQADLVSDGWMVIRHDVDRGLPSYPEEDPTYNAAAYKAQVQQMRSIIKTDYDADPANVKAVFLFGHVAVPYSGMNSFAADGPPWSRLWQPSRGVAR
jgi:hypothetical protein